jgi:rhodanese-related sulfurtransferase
MDVQQFAVDGLGCASYLVGCEVHGIAAVIDPDRDVGQYLDAAAVRGARITHIIETHLHADHVSGNTDLAARTGAAIYVHEAGHAQFPHTPMRDGDVVGLGTARLHVRHTPGHTPESITVLAADLRRSGEPWLAFTGDTDLAADALPGMLGSASAPVVLDVREPWEFAQGHVPGARLLPLGQLLQRVRELDPARPTAVICETGNRSPSAAALLRHRGFAAVHNVAGGTAAWVRSGFPVE